MKSSARVFTLAAIGVLLVGLLTVATYNALSAVLLWPGFLLINAAASHLGFYEFPREHFAWEVIGATVIDIGLYGLLFGMARGALVLFWKRQDKPKPGNYVT